MLPFCASGIETVVHNFDFTHVIKCLKGLSKKHLKALIAKDCWLTFDLRFSAADMRARKLQEPKLDKWLHFFDKFSVKRGGMFTSYHAKEKSDRRAVSAWIPELAEKEERGDLAGAKEGSELQYGMKELSWIIEEFEYHFK